MRWALCTDDIYYAHPVLTNIFNAGRTMPIKRSRGMEQPLFKVTGLLLTPAVVCPYDNMFPRVALSAL